MSRTLDPSAFASICDPVPAATFCDMLFRTGFSAEAYRDRYGDFTPLNWGPTEALGHYVHHGLDERRDVPITLDPDALVALATLPLGNQAFRGKLLSALGLHLFDNAAHPYGPSLTARWPEVNLLRELGARPFLLTGDSHSSTFKLPGARGGEWLLPIHLLCTAGSATGLGNPASRSGYGTLLQDAVAAIGRLPGADQLPLLIQFGQVDIEFVHHFQRVRANATDLDLDAYRAFCDDTVRSYLNFLDRTFDRDWRRRVFVVSVFPPVISDEAWRQGYVNGDIPQRETGGDMHALSAGIRGLLVASLRQRTDIHLYFNAALRTGAQRLGFRFVDAATPFLGPDGLVDPRYVVPEAMGKEHHLDMRHTYQNASELIWRCLDAPAPEKPGPEKPATGPVSLIARFLEIFRRR